MQSKPNPIAHLPQSFVTKKRHILEQISVPTEQYDDLSPKGSIDEQIRGLITWINGYDGWVTTSSCAGRVSVFVEGRKKARTGKGVVHRATSPEDVYYDRGDLDAELIAKGLSKGIELEKIEETGTMVEDGDDRSKEKYEDTGRDTSREAGIGGKGGGGKWIFTSHDPMNGKNEGMDITSFLGMKQSLVEPPFIRSFTEERLIHFKFEPMILHILTASHSHAQPIISAALQAGFRESGAINLSSNTSGPAMPMVAIRSTGLALDCIIGSLSLEDEAVSFVSNGYLMGLLDVANERFEENTRRIQRFWDLLEAAKKGSDGGGKVNGGDWEDADVRRERKRTEGLKKSEEMKQSMARKLEGD